MSRNNGIASFQFKSTRLRRLVFLSFHQPYDINCALGRISGICNLVFVNIAFKPQKVLSVVRVADEELIAIAPKRDLPLDAIFHWLELPSTLLPPQFTLARW